MTAIEAHSPSILVLKSGKEVLLLEGRKIQIRTGKPDSAAFVKLENCESLLEAILHDGKSLHYYSAAEPMPHSFIFGQKEIYFVHLDSGVVEPIAQFNRLSVAPGQFVKILPTEFFTAIVYEAGACALTASGKCLWQTPLETSDKFLGATGETLIYKNEDFGTEFKIDLMDGRVFCD